MGFPHVEIAPGATQAVHTSPVQDVRVLRFTSPPMSGLVMLNLQVGSTSLMMSNEQSGVPLDVELDWFLESPTPLHAGAQATLLVQNLTAKPITFRGAVLWCE